MLIWTNVVRKLYMGLFRALRIKLANAKTENSYQPAHTYGPLIQPFVCPYTNKEPLFTQIKDAVAIFKNNCFLYFCITIWEHTFIDNFENVYFHSFNPCHTDLN